MLENRSCNPCDRRDGEGDGHCYRIEAVMHLIDVMAMLMAVMDIVIIRSRNACDRRDCDVDGHCYRIEVLMHVIDVMAMVIEVFEIVIGLKL